MTEPKGSSVRGGMWIDAGGVLSGYAIDDWDPATRLAVEILADGEPVALLRAEQGLALDSADVGGDGCHGFSLRLSVSLLAQAHKIVARLANRHEVLGAVEVGGATSSVGSPPVSPGVVTWRSGTRLTGHVPRERDGDPVPTVRALIDGIEVARAPCRGWVQLDHGGVARRFDLELPAPYADGRARAVEVVSAAGTPLAGSPCVVAAFPDPLADWIDGWVELDSEKLRARFADGLLPRTLPLSEIEGWLERFPLPEIAEGDGSRVAVVVVGKDGWSATTASLDRQIGASWRAVALPAVGSPVGFDPRRLVDILIGEAADCPLIVMTVAGTRFAPDALARLAEAAARYPRASAVYPDVLVTAPDGRRWPSGFPAFDPELFLERGYCGLVYAVRRADLVQAPPREPSLFGYFPGSAGTPREAWPVHVPFPIATVPDLSNFDLADALRSATRARLADDGEAAEVEAETDGGAPSVRVRRSAPRAGVSVLIAVRDEPAALERTLLSLERDCAQDTHEIVVVDNESSDRRMLDLLIKVEATGHRVLRVPGWFCPARLLSLGAEAAHGDHLLFLKAGVTGSGDWLGEMQGRLAGRHVGVVGALVSWTSGVVRDAGYVIGPRFSLAPRFIDRMVGDPGYGGLLAAAHGCSALSSACLMTPRALFRSLGVFDAQNFPRHLFAPDYCLRVGAAGQRVVFTPHARMSVTVRSGTGGPTPAAAPAREREARLFFDRWAVVPGCDPFYSPWMAMDDTPYSGLAWPPGPFRLRAGERPAPSPFPFGL